MLQALSERELRPDPLIGTSAGAINAAYLAGHGAEPDALEELAAIWRAPRYVQLSRMVRLLTSRHRVL